MINTSCLGGFELNDDTRFVVPKDRRTFLSILNRFQPPEITGAPLGSVNPILSAFARALDKGYGVFVITKDWLRQIEKKIVSWKLQLEAFYERSMKAISLGDSEKLIKRVEQSHSTPVRTRIRPPVRHNHARLAAKSFFRRR